MTAIKKQGVTQILDNIQLQNASLIAIDFTPLKKARLTFQTFPSKTNSSGEQYDLIFTQFTNFEVNIDKFPCGIESLKTLKESVFLKNAMNDFLKINSHAQPDELVHINILLDCGSLDIVVAEYCLLKVWSVS